MLIQKKGWITINDQKELGKIKEIAEETKNSTTHPFGNTESVVVYLNNTLGLQTALLEEGLVNEADANEFHLVEMIEFFIN